MDMNGPDEKVVMERQPETRTLATSLRINPFGVLPVNLDQQLCLLIGRIGPLCETLTNSSMWYCSRADGPFEPM